MKPRSLYALWAALFILCAGLGFIPEPEGNLRVLLILISLLFFLPPACLLYWAGKNRNRDIPLLIRNLSLLSLLLTLVLLILNFLSAFSSESLGLILYYMLTIVSSPMVCSGHWAMCLFLWACLLMGSLREIRRSK